MAEESPGSKQEIVAGDHSQNFQALRDVNVHNHAVPPAAPSLIQKPTNAQVAAFDPKTAAVVRVAGDIVGRDMIIHYARSPLRLVVFIVTWIAAALLILWWAFR